MRFRAIGGALSFLLVGIVLGVAAGSVQAAESQQKDPRELVLRVKNSSVEDLKKLSFLDLNFLKNAIFASRGYVFADDRPWLNEFFCGRTGWRAKRSTVQAVQGVMSSWLSGLRNETRWDLSEYQFPPCKDSGPITEDQKKAIANIRVALYKKIGAFGSIAAVDRALNQEMQAVPTNNAWAWILGKPIQYAYLQMLGAVSIRRDIHGLHRMMALAQNKYDFDSMELLGLFAGDIMFLRNVIEAQHGKQFSGIVGWEISQFIGVTEKRADYDPNMLPAPVRAKLQQLDDIIRKILASDLNDIPESLKNKTVQFSEPYDFEGC